MTDFSAPSLDEAVALFNCVPGGRSGQIGGSGGGGGANVSEALDNGRIEVGTHPDSLPGAECPPTINGGVAFAWRKHAFEVWGTLVRQQVLRTWPWGEAEYALPIGPHESFDGKAIIWSGVVRGKCFGYPNSSGTFEGYVSLTWISGDAEELR